MAGGDITKGHNPLTSELNLFILQLIIIVSLSRVLGALFKKLKRMFLLSFT